MSTVHFQFFEMVRVALFGGIKPTAKHPSDLIAVLSDKTLCYVNSISRMAAGLGAENVCVIDAEEIICT